MKKPARPKAKGPRPPKTSTASPQNLIPSAMEIVWGGPVGPMGLAVLAPAYHYWGPQEWPRHREWLHQLHAELADRGIDLGQLFHLGRLWGNLCAVSRWLKRPMRGRPMRGMGGLSMVRMNRAYRAFATIAETPECHPDARALAVYEMMRLEERIKNFRQEKAGRNAVSLSDVRGERRVTLVERKRKGFPAFWNWEIADAMKTLRFRGKYSERQAAKIVGQFLRTLFPRFGWTDAETSQDRIRARYRAAMQSDHSQ